MAMYKEVFFLVNRYVSAAGIAEHTINRHYHCYTHAQFLKFDLLPNIKLLFKKIDFRML